VTSRTRLADLKPHIRAGATPDIDCRLLPEKFPVASVWNLFDDLGSLNDGHLPLLAMRIA